MTWEALHLPIFPASGHGPARLPRLIGGETVRRHLSFPACIAVIADAMRALSDDRIGQPLREVVALGQGRLFGIMPGVLADAGGCGGSDGGGGGGGGSDGGVFGAKLVSVFSDPARPTRHRHQGVVILFDGEHGAPIAVIDAEEITRIRTAAASAVATDALARRDARTLGIIGTGLQAQAHIEALMHVRAFDRVLVAGRDPDSAATFAARAAAATGLSVSAAAPRTAAGCDVVCTVTTARDPVVFGHWVADGAHVNLVGSSMDGPREADDALVSRARFVADSRASVLAQGAEFRHAVANGLVDEAHCVAEIGEILLGRVAGRQGDRDVTLYKSLGHVVQDLAAGAHVLACVERAG